MSLIARLRALPLTILAACAGALPPSSLAAGRLVPCPSRENCVSTHPAEPPGRRMAPIAFAGTAERAQEGVRRALEAEPRTTIIEDRPGYLRAECRSRIFRFVDDVEIVIDRDGRLLHFRSAARLGRSDRGVNRARMERVAERLSAVK